MTYVLMHIHINSVKRLDFYAFIVSVKLGVTFQIPMVIRTKNFVFWDIYHNSSKNELSL